MAETIVFPDVTAAMTTLLRSRLAALGSSVPVGTRVPNPRPAAFVLVRRVGGATRNLVVDEATLVVEAWAANESASHDLAQLARAVVHSALGTTTTAGTIYRTDEFAGPASLPDPDSDQARHTFTVSVAARGVAV